MIGKLTGLILEKNPPQILLDVSGIAYEVDVPMSTFYQLPNIGENCSIYCHLMIREDAHTLFGFFSKYEKDTFKQLIKISGIGARTALSILSGLSVDDLALAILNEDSNTLSQVPGIGKKTADRLILELKGKFNHSEGSSSAGRQTNVHPSNKEDILNALQALGYNEKESLIAIKGLTDTTSVNDGIRYALKNLLRS